MTIFGSPPQGMLAAKIKKGIFLTMRIEKPSAGIGPLHGPVRPYSFSSGPGRGGSPGLNPAFKE